MFTTSWPFLTLTPGRERRGGEEWLRFKAPPQWGGAARAPHRALTAGFALGVQQDVLHRCLSQHIAAGLPDDGNGVEDDFASTPSGVPGAVEEVVHQDAVQGEAGLGGHHAWKKAAASGGFGSDPGCVASPQVCRRNILGGTVQGRTWVRHDGSAVPRGAGGQMWVVTWQS